MCGISGFIGESKKPVMTYQLITKLFDKSEIRGADAAGFWGTQTGEIVYHKEPCRSSHFVKKDVWRKVAKLNPSIMLVHARAASKGVGEPECNKNNHPFVSFDKSVGLIHNGRIEDYEYQTLKQKYEVQSECDSEILLRIFENPTEVNEDKFDNRLSGIRDIFSFINEGHMAVAIGERYQNQNLLWLFRNRFRPLWVVDMRELLGQIFFVSEPRIWELAVRECGIRNISQTQKLIELPVEEVWFFKSSDKEPTPSVQRYEVEKSDGGTPWKFDGNRLVVKPSEDPVPESPAENPAIAAALDEVKGIGREIHQTVARIVGETSALVKNCSLHPSEYEQIVSKLNKIKKELTEVYIPQQ